GPVAGATRCARDGDGGMKRVDLSSFLGSLVVLAGVLALWWLASHQAWISKVFLPTPEATFASLREGLDDGALRAQTGATEQRLREVAAALQLPRRDFIWKIGLPNALPDILSGMRLAMTVSLIVAVVGEMIASQSGLGQAILLAARSFRASELFAGIVLLGV